MKTKKPAPEKKYFTVAEANATLPLARAIVKDITTLARDLRERHERLKRLEPNEGAKLGQAYQEEVEQVRTEFERDQERMRDFLKELNDLGIQLKDFDTGLLDFPCLLDGREVYLCWKQGEPEVTHWHEIDAGFKGRREITPDFGRRQRAESSGVSN
ncbi:MAG TPA: DUF2203 domain-containing protein [Gemmataceae bacterium]|nr:DUF2203 domain-containing protein [Gemmataceae bacterium]